MHVFADLRVAFRVSLICLKAHLRGNAEHQLIAAVEEAHAAENGI